LHVYVASSTAEIDRLEPLWDFLYAQTSSATLFQSFAWNRLAATRFARRAHSYVVVAENDSGAALIPAAVAQNRLTLLGEALFDYRDVLCVGSEDVLQAAWRRLADLQLPLAFTALRGQAACARWSALAPAPFVGAPQTLCAETSAPAFAAGHSRLGRTLRRLAEHGVGLCRHHGGETDLVAWIYRQKAMQLAGTPDNLFQDPLRVDFMVAACSLDPRRCEIFVFEKAGRPITTLVTFRDGVFRRFYTIWFDSAWAQYSPGTALCFEAAHRSLEEGLNCDYMTGEQPHKTRFATSVVPLFHVNATAEQLARIAANELPIAA
jgi:CelD/BcsL family acetyltransferase involved in cellulose biosynthesis